MNDNNPFVIQGYLSPAYFCDREEETNKIISAVENRRNITLYSLRRIGKTGLIHNVFYNLGKTKKYELFYIDIYPTSNLNEFINTFAQAILGKLDSASAKILKQIGTVFSSIRPQISYDPLTGSPTIQLNIRNEAEAKSTLSNVFNYIEKQDKQVIIAFDEFQQIVKYPEKNMEALLRSFIQEAGNTRFIFSGSQQEMLLSIFGDRSRPFYQSTEFVHLGFLEREVYLKFILKNFKDAKINISEQSIDFLLDWTNSHTFYVQYICNRLYSLGEKELTDDIIKSLLAEILKENEQLYLGYRNFITENQWYLLKAVAKENTIKQITSKNFIGRYNLGTPSSVKSALNALLGKELVYFDNQVYRIYDVFLQRWLQTIN